MTVGLVGTDLRVLCDAAGDEAFLTSDGSRYTVEGTGLSATSFTIASVESIGVTDTGGFPNQAFTVRNGSAVVDRLTVDASIESTAIVGVLDVASAAPAVSIGSAAITLASDVTSRGGPQYFGGAVTLLSDVTLTARTVTTASTIAGTGKALTVVGEAAVNGAISGLSRYSVAGNVSLGASVTTSGAQTYAGPVTLRADVAVVATAGGDVTFASRVKSSPLASRSLSVSTGGTTELDGDVGGRLDGLNSLGSLSIDAGSIRILSRLVFTSGVGGQTYRGPVTLGNHLWMTAAAAAPVTFTGSVDALLAPVNLAVNTGGRTRFGGLVGGSAALANLWTNPGGSTRFDAVTSGGQATVRTVGAQVYDDDVVLGEHVLLSSGDGGEVNLGGRVSSSPGTARNLETSTRGTTTFGGVVGGALGGTVSLGSLKTGTGPTIIRGALVNTSGGAGQSYGGPVLLGGDVWLNSGDAATVAPIGFAATIDSLPAGASAPSSPYDLAVLASGLTTFRGFVGGTTALRNLWTGAADGRVDAGRTVWDAPPTSVPAAVRTVGSQTYADDVSLARDTGFRSGDAVTFSRTIESIGAAAALTVGAWTTTTFAGTVGGAVGGPGTLASVHVTMGTTVIATPLIRTSDPAGQTFDDPVELRSSAWLDAGAGPIAFRSNVDSAPGTTASLALLARNIWLGGAVGGVVPLESLSIGSGSDAEGAGSTWIAGRSVATVGDAGQSYHGDVFLGENTAFTTGRRGALVFHGSLEGSGASFATGTGPVILYGSVGGRWPLRGMDISSAGSVYAARAIRLEGAEAPFLPADGLVIGAGVDRVIMAAPGNTITGFRGAGIRFLGGSIGSFLSQFTVRGNWGHGIVIAAGDYTGSRIQSSSIASSGADGVFLDPAGGSLSGLLIGGGAGQGNLIRWNGTRGIEAAVGDFAGVTIAGNEITGNGFLDAVAGDGILVRGSHLLVGWDAAPFGSLPAPAPSNTISGNAGNGIRIVTGVGNSLLSNAIFGNGSADGTIGKGIALDAGGNGGQIAPEIRRVAWNRSTNVFLVDLIVPAAGRFAVQLFRNLAADMGGTPPTDAVHVEGRFLVGPARAGQPLASGSPSLSGVGVIEGNVLVTLEIPGPGLAGGDRLTATATELRGTKPGGTSEFSKAFLVRK